VELRIYADAEALAAAAAELFRARVMAKPDLAMAVPAGRTPRRMYALMEAHQAAGRQIRRSVIPNPTRSRLGDAARRREGAAESKRCWSLRRRRTSLRCRSTAEERRDGARDGAARGGVGRVPQGVG